MVHEGVNTGPVVISLSMIFHARRYVRPTHTLVAFDSPGKTLRHQFYEPYKANRKSAIEHPPEDKERPMALTLQLLGLLGFGVAIAPGFEADDIIATAWGRWRAEHPDEAVYVLSGDKDLAQLVDARTTLLRPEPGGPVALDLPLIRERFGAEPEHLPIYMAMVGDVSDNVPGVSGVGPVKAAKIMDEAGADLHAVIDIIDSRWGQEKVEQFLTAYTLVLLRDGPLNAPLKDSTPREFACPPDSDLGEALALCDTYLLERLSRAILDGDIWDDDDILRHAQHQATLLDPDALQG